MTDEAAWHERCSWKWAGGEKITGMGKTGREGETELYVGTQRTVGHSRAVEVVVSGSGGRSENWISGPA